MSQSLRTCHNTVPGLFAREVSARFSKKKFQSPSRGTRDIKRDNGPNGQQSVLVVEIQVKHSLVTASQKDDQRGRGAGGTSGSAQEEIKDRGSLRQMSNAAPSSHHRWRPA